MYATMPDITVSGRSGLVLAVEVKNLPAWTADDADAYVKDLFDGGASLGTQYLMLLSQETAFVWRVASAPSPTLVLLTEMPVTSIFDAYRHRAGVTNRLYGEDLQMLAVTWLGRICDGVADAEEVPPQLAETGLAEALRGGTISWVVA